MNVERFYSAAAIVFWRVCDDTELMLNIDLPGAVTRFCDQYNRPYTSHHGGHGDDTDAKHVIASATRLVEKCLEKSDRTIDLPRLVTTLSRGTFLGDNNNASSSSNGSSSKKKQSKQANSTSSDGDGGETLTAMIFTHVPIHGLVGVVLEYMDSSVHGATGLHLIHQLLATPRRTKPPGGGYNPFRYHDLWYSTRSAPVPLDTNLLQAITHIADDVILSDLFSTHIQSSVSRVHMCMYH